MNQIKMSFLDKEVVNSDKVLPLQLFSFDIENSEITSVADDTNFQNANIVSTDMEYQNELPTCSHNTKFSKKIEQLKQKLNTQQIDTTVQTTQQTSTQMNYNNQGFKLSITGQPIEMMAFRLASDMKSKDKFTPRGYLYKRNSNKEPISVRLDTLVYTEDEKYYVRCSLYQPQLENSNSKGGYRISPHMLCHADRKLRVFDSENKFFEMKSMKSDNCYQFELKDFVIIKSLRASLYSSCVTKYTDMMEQNELYGIIYSDIVSYVPPYKGMEINSLDVVICFEAFKYISDRNYKLIAGPEYSDSITDSKNASIVKILNGHGDIKGGTEVTLLVDGFNIKTNYFIEISDQLGWKKTKNIEKENTHANKTIWFCMPQYSGLIRNQHLIKCVIKLGRKKDGKLSNGVPFTYTTQFIWLPEFECRMSQARTVHFRTRSYPYIRMDENKIKFYRILLKNFKYYEQESPCSALHELFQDFEPKKYVDKYCSQLGKIMQEFHLNDRIREDQTYDQMALTYACIFDYPTLMSIKNLDDGNNFLHQIAQQQSAMEIRKNFLMQLNKASNRRNSYRHEFEKALRAYNESGLTPLHIGVMHNDVEFVENILEYCKRRDQLQLIAYRERTDGNTILHQAAIDKSAAMYECILKYVSNDTILKTENYCGETAEDIKQNMDNPLINSLVHSLSVISFTSSSAESIADTSSDSEQDDMRTTEDIKQNRDNPLTHSIAQSVSAINLSPVESISDSSCDSEHDDMRTTEDIKQNRDNPIINSLVHSVSAINLSPAESIADSSFETVYDNIESCCKLC